MPDEANVQTPIATKFKPHENFESWYSNNAQFFPSEWDLKIVFGEIEPQNDGTIDVLQHTAIVQSWLQVKLMHYWLTLHLGIYEIAHGTIQVPISVLPPVPALPQGNLVDDPASKRAYEFISQVREGFMRGQTPMP